DIARIGNKLVDELPAVPAAISIAALESLPMPRIIRIFEHVLGKTANCTYVDKGAPMPVDTVQVQETSASLGIDLGGDYVERVIAKYYAADADRRQPYFPITTSSGCFNVNSIESIADSPSSSELNVSIVVPVYGGSAALPDLCRRLETTLQPTGL